MHLSGFIVTWDVDSRNKSLCGRLHRFIFGYILNKNEREYRYPGFIERPGVRYLGQSVLFVTKGHLEALCGFLRANGLVPVVTEAWLGRILRL